MSAKMWGNGCRTTMICIDTYENGVPVGRFYNQYSADGILFHGAIDLIKKIDTMLNQMGTPQSFSRVRAFAEKPVADMTDAAKKVIDKGKVATFRVKVLFRQHTSWQGVLCWVGEDVQQQFRSVLELIILLDSALNSRKERVCSGVFSDEQK